MPRFILVMDEGTTSSRAILFDHSGQIVSLAHNKNFPRSIPRQDWLSMIPRPSGQVS